MKQDEKVLLAIIVVIAGLILYNQGALFTIYLQSAQVQYTNQPIEAKFTLADYTNPTIKTLFNGQQMYTAEEYTVSNITEEVTLINNSIDPITNLSYNTTYVVNESREVKVYPAVNQKYAYTYQTSNGTYILKLSGVTETGIFKFIVSEGNKTEIQTVEVRSPFVNIQTDMKTLVDEGTIDKITIKTLTPQGAELEIESLDMEVTKPDNSVETLTAVKDGTKFTVTTTYKENGNYIYKIKGRKAGYDSKEFTVAVSVTKNSTIPPIIWIWIAAPILLILWIAITLVRRK
jgi:hypothetical protein